MEFTKEQKYFSLYLRRQRAKKGLTQKALSELAGIPLGSLKNIEYENVSVSLKMACVLLKALGRTLTDFDRYMESCNG